MPPSSLRLSSLKVLSSRRLCSRLLFFASPHHFLSSRLLPSPRQNGRARTVARAVDELMVTAGVCVDSLCTLVPFPRSGPSPFKTAARSALPANPFGLRPRTLKYPVGQEERRRAGARPKRRKGEAAGALREGENGWGKYKAAGGW